jgi:hypothetical protein
LPFRLCGSVASSRLTRLHASPLELPGRPHGHSPECQLPWLSSLRQQLPCCLPHFFISLFSSTSLLTTRTACADSASALLGNCPPQAMQSCSEESERAMDGGPVTARKTHLAPGRLEHYGNRPMCSREWLATPPLALLPRQGVTPVTELLKQTKFHSSVTFVSIAPSVPVPVPVPRCTAPGAPPWPAGPMMERVSWHGAWRRTDGERSARGHLTTAAVGRSARCGRRPVLSPPPCAGKLALPMPASALILYILNIFLSKGASRHSSNRLQQRAITRGLQSMRCLVIVLAVPRTSSAPY